MKQVFWLCVIVAIVIYFSSGNNTIKVSGIERIDNLVTVKIDRSKHYTTLSNTTNSTTLNETTTYTNTQ